MKHLITFLGGASFMSAVVVASNSQPGWMFLFGVILSSVIFFVLSPHWSSGDVGVPALRRWSKAGARGAELPPQLQKKPGVPASAQARWSGASGVPAQINLDSTSDLHASQLHSRERLRTTTYEPKARRAPCKTNKKEVQFAMLRPIQQDILSALVNLKVPYSDAYNVALANTSASFDEAFKVAIASLGGLTKERFEESRRAAA